MKAGLLTGLVCLVASLTMAQAPAASTPAPAKAKVAASARAKGKANKGNHEMHGAGAQTAAQQSILLASQISTLSAAQKTQLNALKTSTDAKVAVIRKQNKPKLDAATDMKAKMTVLRDMRTQYQPLNQEVQTQLSTILTPAQKTELGTKVSAAEAARPKHRKNHDAAANASSTTDAPAKAGKSGKKGHKNHKNDSSTSSTTFSK